MLVSVDLLYDGSMQWPSLHLEMQTPRLRREAGGADASGTSSSEVSISSLGRSTWLKMTPNHETRHTTGERR